MREPIMLRPGTSETSSEESSLATSEEPVRNSFSKFRGGKRPKKEKPIERVTRKSGGENVDVPEGNDREESKDEVLDTNRDAVHGDAKRGVVSISPDFTSSEVGEDIDKRSKILKQSEMCDETENEFFPYQTEKEREQEWKDIMEILDMSDIV